MVVCVDILSVQLFQPVHLVYNGLMPVFDTLAVAQVFFWFFCFWKGGGGCCHLLAACWLLVLLWCLHEDKRHQTFVTLQQRTPTYNFNSTIVWNALKTCSFMLYIYNLTRKPFWRERRPPALLSQHLGYWHQSKLKLFKWRTVILPRHVKNTNDKGKQYNILIRSGKVKYKVYMRIYIYKHRSIQ